MSTGSASPRRVSAQLRALYLGEERSGVPWLVDPDSRAATGMLREAESRQPGDPCDADALAADLGGDAEVLLHERHLGFATGELVGGDVDEAIAERMQSWARRLHDERPGTWGQAIGVDGYVLRRLLRDSHCYQRGEDPDLLARVDPRHDDPVFSDPGPAVEEHRYGDTLYFRLRRFGGGPGDLHALEAWCKGHARHFAAERIVVDLRGNGGGGDRFTAEWIQAHTAETVTFGEAALWLVDGRQLASWTGWVTFCELYGRDNDRARQLRHGAFSPTPASELELRRDALTLQAGTSPWKGQMLVVIDAGVASAAESSTIFLRDGLCARVVGTPSAGRMAFGNMACYPLARSGMVLRLPTTRFGYPPVEFTGIPVAATLDDPCAGPARIAADFDDLWTAAA